MAHLRHTFDQDLKTLEEQIQRMGRMAGEQIHRAVDALNRQDAVAADRIIGADDEVDALHMEIERRVVILLATQQPMATDLRELASTLAISIDLERLADHAEGISKAVKRLGDPGPLHDSLVDIALMEETVQEMLRDVLDAFLRRDAALAESLGPRDDTVDAMRSQVFRALLTYMAEDPHVISKALEVILAAQHLERAADHITNIAERVIYMVTGEMKEINV